MESPLLSRASELLHGWLGILRTAALVAAQIVAGQIASGQIATAKIASAQIVMAPIGAPQIVTTPMTTAAMAADQTAGTEIAAAEPTETLAAVAANFSPAMEPLVSRFAARTGHQLTVVVGGTGSLYAQVVNGAPFDILLAADSERPQRLEADGEAVAGSRFTYAVGRLALWRPLAAGTATTGTGEAPGPIEDATILIGDGFRHLAVADPTTAPYGRAAREALERLGLAGSLAGRIVRGQNIGQTYQFVAGGAAEVGLVALSQVIGEDPSVYWILPESLHEPIVQQAVLLRPGRENSAAVAFLEFLKSDEARRVLADFGYALPER